MKSSKFNILYIIFLTIPLLFTACSSIYESRTYLTHIEIANGESNKNPIYIECDILGDSIVKLDYLQQCKIQINKLYRFCNSVKINTVYKDVIMKYHFKIYRYNEEKKDYISFEAWRLAYPNGSDTWDEDINETRYVHFFIYVVDEYFESNLKQTIDNEK